MSLTTLSYALHFGPWIFLAAVVFVLVMFAILVLVLNRHAGPFELRIGPLEFKRSAQPEAPRGDELIDP